MQENLSKFIEDDLGSLPGILIMDSIGRKIAAQNLLVKKGRVTGNFYAQNIKRDFEMTILILRLS